MPGAQSACPPPIASRWVGHRRTFKRLGQALLDHYRKPRVLGLDLLRIVAAFTIVVFHGNVTGAFGHNAFSSAVTADGYLAVDIFFVLSGWLLTRQVLRMRSPFQHPLRFATRFWARRWARTLPPYWVVLLGIFLLRPWLDPKTFWHPWSVAVLLKHAFFLQTLLPPNAYGVTWSLVTEEWFYLLLPFAVMLAARVGSRRLLVGLGLALLLVPATVRAVLLTTSTPWGPGILNTPQARFEGLVIGALLAVGSMRAPWWDRQVTARHGWLFGLGMVLVTGMLVAGVGDSRAYRVFGILAFNLGIGLLMPSLSQLRWPNTAPAFMVMGSAFLSELTYPLYLLHQAIPTHWTHIAGPARIGYAILGLGGLLAAATLLHLAIERPFLALRDRRDAPTARPRHGAAWRRPVPDWTEPVAAASSPRRQRAWTRPH
jgi:peptidoglycan/LPS O-acetylase OafA/YrhL